MIKQNDTCEAKIFSVNMLSHASVFCYIYIYICMYPLAHIYPYVHTLTLGRVMWNPSSLQLHCNRKVL